MEFITCIISFFRKLVLNPPQFYYPGCIFDIEKFLQSVRRIFIILNTYDIPDACVV